METLIISDLKALETYSFIKKDSVYWVYEEIHNNHVINKLLFNSRTSTIYADNFAENKHYSGICKTYHELDNILELCKIHQNLKLI